MFSQKIVQIFLVLIIFFTLELTAESFSQTARLNVQNINNSTIELSTYVLCMRNLRVISADIKFRNLSIDCVLDQITNESSTNNLCRHYLTLYKFGIISNILNLRSVKEVSFWATVQAFWVCNQSNVFAFSANGETDRRQALDAFCMGWFASISTTSMSANEILCEKRLLQSTIRVGSGTNEPTRKKAFTHIDMCQPNSLYCGHKLDEMGQLSYVNYSNTNSVYKCSPLGFFYHEENCASCSRFDKSSAELTCLKSIQRPQITFNTKACSTIRKYYCGHELEHMLGYRHVERHGLYVCVESYKVQYVTTCEQRCRRFLEGTSGCHCVPGKPYCGYELLRMNYLNPSDIQKADRLYSCVNESFAEWHPCEGTCVKNSSHVYCSPKPKQISPCTIGSYYCGYKLQAMNYANILTHGLYYCGSVDLPLLHYNCPGECQAPVHPHLPYCKCIKGKKHCGHALKQFNFIFDTLLPYRRYQCTNESSVDTIDTCGNFCMSDVNEGAICVNRSP